MQETGSDLILSQESRKMQRGTSVRVLQMTRMTCLEQHIDHWQRHFAHSTQERRPTVDCILDSESFARRRLAGVQHGLEDLRVEAALIKHKLDPSPFDASDCFCVLGSVLFQCLDAVWKSFEKRLLKHSLVLGLGLGGLPGQQILGNLHQHSKAFHGMMHCRVPCLIYSL